MNTIKNKAQQKGFTLIELMIVVAIIAILAAIGYPSYIAQVQKAARKESIGKMLEVAGRLEQYRTQKFSYPTSTADLGAYTDNGKKYTVTVTAPSGDGSDYAVVSTPLAGTNQTSDLCGTLTYTSPGTWAFSGAGATEANCL